MPRGGEKSNGAKYELGTTNQILEIVLLIINALQRQDWGKNREKSKNPRFSNSLKETWAILRVVIFRPKRDAAVQIRRETHDIRDGRHADATALRNVSQEHHASCVAADRPAQVEGGARITGLAKIDGRAGGLLPVSANWTPER